MMLDVAAALLSLLNIGFNHDVGLVGDARDAKRQPSCTDTNGVWGSAPDIPSIICTFTKEMPFHLLSASDTIFSRYKGRHCWRYQCIDCA